MKRFQQTVLLCLVVTFVAGGLLRSIARDGLPVTPKQAPGFYRAKLGAFDLIALSDGTAPRSLEQILSDPSLVRDELLADHEREPVQLSINAYLIKSGSHLVLVDTGAGELFGPSSGLLVANLISAGYRADQVDVILLTHIHGDHSGGLSIGGKRQFPNALVYVDHREVAHWLNKEEEQKAAPSARITFEQSQATVNPYILANRVIEIEGNSEVVPGISAQSAPGHTPGHTAYLVESQGHKLLLWGDTVHCAEVQFRHPAVTVQYDVDSREARQTRVRLLDSAATSGVLVGSDHISFPGLGRVRKTDGGYSWIPIPYTAAVTEIDPRP
jgi:glyoxylase-like metal-dependent hydrolase (beta-lactamase superfamily II)